MWRINEVISLDDNLHRILHLDQGLVYWIDLIDDKGMPEAIQEFQLVELLNSERLKRNDDPYAYLQTQEPEPESVTFARREKSYDIIKSIISDTGVFDRKTRAERVKKVVDEGLASKATVYKLLRRYWQRGQCHNALLPDYKNSGAPGKSRVSEKYKKLGRKRRYGEGEGGKVTEDVQDLFRIIINKYLMTTNPLSQSEAYSRFVALFSEHYPHQPKANIPTKRQFTYFFKKEYASHRVKRQQNTLPDYLKDFRPLKSTATTGAHGPGFRYEIDATIADIYLVSDVDRNQIIGRPTIYFVVDVYSRMVAGFYIGFDDPSYPVAMQAIVTACTDKVDLCRQLGIDIETDDWPCTGLPYALLADRGELLGHQVEALVKNFSVRVENTPPYRGDAKGIVESHFKTIPAQFKPYTPGIVKGARIKKHAEKDYRLEAMLTVREFTQIILHTVLFRNNHKTMESYDRDAGLPPEIPSIPLAIWNWGLQHKAGSLRTADAERLRVILLPRKQVSMSQYGLCLWGLYYTSSEIFSEGWLHRGRGTHRPQTLLAAYDPGSVDVIYLFPHKGQREFWRCYLTDRSRRFQGMSFWQVWEMQHEEKDNQANYQLVEQTKKTELLEKIDSIMSRVERSDTKPEESDSQRLRAIKENKRDAKHEERKQRAKSNNKDDKRQKPATVSPLNKPTKNSYGFPSFVPGLFEDSDKPDKEED